MGSGCQVKSLGFRIVGLGFGFRVLGLGFRVWGYVSVGNEGSGKRGRERLKGGEGSGFRD